MKRAGRGRFIVLEGLDGAGTTTQAQRLGSWLRGRGRRVHVTAEPSGGPVGSLVRQVLSRRVVGSGKGQEFDPAALGLLFAADRLDHLAVEIEPKLAQGIDVVSDRYTPSSLAYQGLTVNGAKRLRDRSKEAAAGWVEEINRFALAPDLTLFLKVDPAMALRRRRRASFDREIFEVSAFQRRVAEWYDLAIERLRIARQRVEVIDGSMPVESVAEAVVRAVNKIVS